jgi:hypothetical protein
MNIGKYNINGQVLRLTNSNGSRRQKTTITLWDAAGEYRVLTLKTTAMFGSIHYCQNHPNSKYTRAILAAATATHGY